MKIRIRLYFYHDLDLVSLYREGRISISKSVKYALNAFARIMQNLKLVVRNAKKPQNRCI